MSIVRQNGSYCHREVDLQRHRNRIAVQADANPVLEARKHRARELRAGLVQAHADFTAASLALRAASDAPCVVHRRRLEAVVEADDRAARLKNEMLHELFQVRKLAGLDAARRILGNLDFDIHEAKSSALQAYLAGAA